MSTHTLIVSGELFYADDDPGHDEPFYDDREYEVRCPGVARECMGWEECIVNGCDHELLELAVDDGDDTWSHGEEHRMIDGRWMTATGRCYVANHDSISEVCWDLEPLEVGEHPVDFDVPDETDLLLMLIEEKP